MTRTSARAKKSKQDVIKKKEEAKQADENQTDSDAAGESTDKENDSTNFDVEKITHTRIFKGKRQYLVRWKGYSEDNDTWENESALQSCKEVLDAFKKEHLAEANSDEEDAEEETVEKVKSKGKKGSKIVKKNNKKSGRTSSQNIKNKDSEIESEEEPEEETKEVKGAKEKSKKETEELEADSEKHSKKKAAKGKKRKLTKETESRPIKEKKTKKDESDDESVTDGKDYEVEKILEVHTRKDGSREFLIRWKGYKPSDDTWEPEAHLDCQELIEKFMEKVDKAKEYSRKELRQRTETKRFVPLNTGSRRTTQRNRGLRPCYQETYED